ncbi:Putative thiosulfate sulfurtransferase [Frankliniella fusca]|uniref:Thiosulfate sulfurtransferase n=1 Tax=Frankliniella fusca TaxID=407009 RepID=A0AAE1HZA7_9NEOP|nr:Putative thiosulfate sulfurtransferase [Frankliniella fusca]
MIVGWSEVHDERSLLFGDERLEVSWMVQLEVGQSKSSGWLDSPMIVGWSEVRDELLLLFGDERLEVSWMVQLEVGQSKSSGWLDSPMIVGWSEVHDERSLLFGDERLEVSWMVQLEVGQSKSSGWLDSPMIVGWSEVRDELLLLFGDERLEGWLDSPMIVGWSELRDERSLLFGDERLEVSWMVQLEVGQSKSSVWLDSPMIVGWSEVRDELSLLFGDERLELDGPRCADELSLLFGDESRLEVSWMVQLEVGQSKSPGWLDSPMIVGWSEVRDELSLLFGDERLEVRVELSLLFGDERLEESWMVQLEVGQSKSPGWLDSPMIVGWSEVRDELSLLFGDERLEVRDELSLLFGDESRLEVSWMVQLEVGQSKSPGWLDSPMIVGWSEVRDELSLLFGDERLEVRDELSLLFGDERLEVGWMVQLEVGQSKSSGWLDSPMIVGWSEVRDERSLLFGDERLALAGVEMAGTATIRDRSSSPLESDMESNISDSSMSSVSTSESSETLQLMEESADGSVVFRIPKEAVARAWARSQVNREKKEKATPRKRGDNSRDNATCSSVKLCESFGYRVANRSGKNVLNWCQVCDTKQPDFDSHLKKPPVKCQPQHEGVDPKRVKAYNDAQCTRGMRGPIYLQPHVAKIVSFESDHEKINAYLINLLGSVGVGVAESASAGMPVYTMKECFKYGWTSNDPLLAVTTATDQEVEEMESE